MRTLILIWLMGGLFTLLAIQAEHCPLSDGHSLAGPIIASAGWPVILIGRLATAAVDPPMAIRPIVCL